MDSRMAERLGTDTCYPVFSDRTLLKGHKLFVKGPNGIEVAWVNGVWFEEGCASEDKWEVRFNCGNTVLLSYAELSKGLEEYRQHVERNM